VKFIRAIQAWLAAVLLAAAPLILTVPGAYALAEQATEKSTYELVLKGGRVIDPESGLDAVRNLAISAGRIIAISDQPLEGERMLDVSSLVVAPGFIDLHSHAPTPFGQRLQVQDGVTTSLELEAGAYPVSDFGGLIRERPLINYGASVGYGSIRMEVMQGIRKPHLLTDPAKPVGFKGYWTLLRSLFSEPREAFTEIASRDELQKLRAALLGGLDQSGIGIGLPLDYFSEGISTDELRMVFEVAGERQAPVFVHIRRGNNGDPTGLREVLGLAKTTGAPLHICHIQHNAMGNIELFLAEIRQARAAGVDVSTELLPYNAGSALISSAVFGRDWQSVFAISYEDVQWAATGEYFNKAMWDEYREKYPDGQVLHHYVKEAWSRRALMEPGVMVVSDLLPIINKETKAAPHVGAFAKVLGRYVRDESLLDLSGALAKMTLLPAQRLQQVAPSFSRKGRLQEGADADIVVFDPNTIIDRATYAEPFLPSRGMVHVLVNGELVVSDGQLRSAVYPGKSLAGKEKASSGV